MFDLGRNTSRKFFFELLPYGSYTLMDLKFDCFLHWDCRRHIEFNFSLVSEIPGSQPKRARGLRSFPVLGSWQAAIHEIPAVDRQNLARNVPRPRRGEKGHPIRDPRGFGNFPERNAHEEGPLH